AQAVVEYLKQAPEVEKVLYPGKGGMISFYLKEADQVERLLDHVKVITFAESLGGIESLITIPYYQTHADVS
ncbi:PLP-dependent transferase, partial [Blautia sp. DFI.9.9]|nr:PLP-dependent transferase [Blautia sp. DFI.9.9]